MNRALHNHHRVEAQWTETTRRVFHLEDVNRNMISNEHVFKRTLSGKAPFWLPHPKIEWYWKCLLEPLLFRAFALIAAVMSVFVIWSEATFFIVHPPLSLFAVFVDAAKTAQNYFAVEAVCFLTICYLCVCVCYTVFKIRVFNYYYLATNHQSDEYTLLFSGALLCRLTPPLCLNFLSLIHMDSHVIESNVMETAYTRIMGHMDVVAIVSDYFNIYFPIALLGLSAATWFSLGARLLTAVGFQQFLEGGDDEVTHEMVDEGKEHIKREKRRIQRLNEAQSRRSGIPQSDIVKNRRSNFAENAEEGFAMSSPERSLLSHSASASNDVVVNEPPRNIFDDL